MKRIIALFLCSFLGVVGVGCGSSRDIQAAADGVVSFHKQLDAEDFLTIYNQADPKLREATKQEDFLAFLEAVHKKLGNVESAIRQGYFINFTTSGTDIRLTYQTKFSSGTADEVFVWHRSGDKLRLLGYHINSNALILK